MRERHFAVRCFCGGEGGREQVGAEKGGAGNCLVPWADSTQTPDLGSPHVSLWKSVLCLAAKSLWQVSDLAGIEFGGEKDKLHPFPPCDKHSNPFLLPNLYPSFLAKKALIFPSSTPVGYSGPHPMPHPTLLWTRAVALDCVTLRESPSSFRCVTFVLSSIWHQPPLGPVTQIIQHVQHGSSPDQHQSDRVGVTWPISLPPSRSFDHLLAGKLLSRSWGLGPAWERRASEKTAPLPRPQSAWLATWLCLF